jgi:Family of unknown function (DUF6519)
MRGDFSRSGLADIANFEAVLQQQGRVLTDADWNDQTWLSDRWRRDTARAAIGGDMAAVPASSPDALAVVGATVSGNDITVAVNPGPVWAGGLFAEFRGAGAGAKQRVTPYLGPPSDGAAPGAAGTRDAVVLELWREEISAFQVPDQLIEPALGGVDTTARIWHGLALRLLRLESGQGCDEIGDRLDDDLASRRRLTVSLEPTQVSNGDCPVVIGGGYSGFEHDLYRVEIADVDGGAAMFKYSRFNGGLVGRGTFDAAVKKVTIRANRQPILRSGLQSFYLEAFQPIPDRGSPERTSALAEEWRLVYGGRAVLASDSEIDLTEDLFGTVPDTGGQSLFFRLWDDVLPVADFTGAPVELRDGIQIGFGAAGPSRPGDYWTFPVRAGDVGNPELLIDDAPPAGPERVRVLLGVLRWGADTTVTRDDNEIEDCRRVFRPLSDLAPGCCVPVAPGDDLPRAIRRIRRQGGGCLCLLPGEHRLHEPLRLAGATDVCIEGFGLASRLVVDARIEAPVFDLRDAANVSFRSFTILQRGSAAVFACAGTQTLTLDGMLVVSRVEPTAHAPVEIADTACSGWRIDDTVLIGPSCMRGARLQASRIARSLFAAVDRGIDVTDMLDVVLSANRIAGVQASAEKEIEAALGRAEGAAQALQKQLDALTQAATVQPDSRFVAVRTSGLFDSRIAGNVMGGRAGVLGEIAENTVIEDNRILTSAIGVSLTMADGVRFAGNVLGQARSDGDGLSPRVGLRLHADATDLRVLDNRFLDVRDAIVFETDANGERDVVRLAEVDFRATPTLDAAVSKQIVAAVKSEVAGQRAGSRLLGTPFAAVGKCERTLIEGNLLQADGIGIEWSGTKVIHDFRVSHNAFVGCRAGAILLEPDDRVHYADLAEPVDTQVRLIDRNRFDILGVAIRSTLGAVRVEKNDVRVRPLPASYVAIENIVNLFTSQVFTLPTFVTAAASKDIGNLRLGAKDVSHAAAANPGAINTASFAALAKSSILDAHTIDQGDVLTDHAFVLHKLALAGEDALVASGSTFTLAPLITDLEAFVVNLSGAQNEVTDNNLLSKNSALDSGVVLQVPSGSVTGNEIEVGHVAMMITAKASQGRRDLTVEGNRLTATGAQSGGGLRPASYALAIPTMTAGNYSILDNTMDGSVMIGAEPFASTGLAKAETLQFGSFIGLSHTLAFDAKSYSSAIAFAAMPAKAIAATTIDPKLVAAVAGTVAAEPFNEDPHKDRTVIQFSANRVVRGFVALARSTGGAFWTKDDLVREGATSPVIQVTGNVFDYWARVVGRDVIIVGNHSQTAIQYRAGSRIEQVANMPAPAEF